MSFAENLRALREQKHYSQKELSELVGINQATIARFELGAKIPNVITAVEIARRLDTTVEELVGGQMA